MLTLGSSAKILFQQPSQAFSLQNLSRLVAQHCEGELSGYWLNWLKEHAATNPFLYDLVPAEVGSTTPPQSYYHMFTLCFQLTVDSILRDNDHQNHHFSTLLVLQRCKNLILDCPFVQVSYEVPFTSDCGCFDLDALSRSMPLYHQIYTKYYEMVMKPLKSAIYNQDITFTIADIEKVKQRGK